MNRNYKRNTKAYKKIITLIKEQELTFVMIIHTRYMIKCPCVIINFNTKKSIESTLKQYKQGY